MAEESAAPVEGQAAQEAPTTANWTDGFSDDLKGFVELKGFKGPDAVADAYRNLEKLRGVPEERLLRLPEKMDDAEGMASVYDRLGRPEAPDKYTRAVPEGFDDGVFKAIAAEAHKAGLTDKQFATMQQGLVAQSAAVAAAQEAASVKAFDAWKAENPEGFNNAARVMQTLGVAEGDLANLLNGDKTALYGFLAKVAARSAEGQTIHGDAPQGETYGISPAAAKQKIATLFADADFMKQYTSTSQKIRQPAIDRMLKLQELAAKAGA